jgi:predicted regulator of Ras-like GTPase activity (Roadblock/LC7/MglB family)
MPLHNELEQLQRQMNLAFILVVSDEGLLMAEVGDSPGEDFAPYSTEMMEMANRMSQVGNFGAPICSALVLQGGRMLIMHEAKVGEHTIYLSILCDKVPPSVRRLTGKITACVSRSLLGK